MAPSRSSSPTRGFEFERLPIPSVLAVGAAHAALTDAGLRGRTDIVADAGRRAGRPRPRDDRWRPARAPSTRGWPSGSPPRPPDRAASRRSTCRARSGACSTPSRPGSERPCPGWGSARRRRTSAGRSSRRWTSRPRSRRGAFRRRSAGKGRSGSVSSPPRQLARREVARRSTLAPRRGRIRRRAAAAHGPREPRLPDPGLARFRSDGELHLFAPRDRQAIQGLAERDAATRRSAARPIGRRSPGRSPRSSVTGSRSGRRHGGGPSTSRRWSPPAPSSGGSSSAR